MKRIRINDINDELFEDAWKLYCESFPLNEQRALDDQKNAMMQEDYHFEALVQAGRFIGILLYWEQSGFIFVEHFAIASNMRSGGLGTKVMGLLLENQKAVILEIEPVSDEQSEKRLNFYARLGFLKNNFMHIQPPFRRQFTGHRLELMSYPEKLNIEIYNEFAIYFHNRVMEFSE
ncbi:MAG: GNAT family N-acetyltransferase [Clostridiaceae bacterium]|nr:GNAT family N-acetyltransferase [Clostridiaceae bacterium]